MSSFISKSACRGTRPDNLLPQRYYQRPRLVSRLIKERGVARFVVAPFGYGKSSLALEYADTVFGFEGVFWINCKSPCFIRDLDEGGIAAACMKHDPNMRLAVFEDVPFLDDERAEAFSHEIDTLLNRKHEVLVTCTPACDSLGRLQRDRVTVTAKDLLLDDEELAATGEGAPESMAARAVRAQSCRVPILIWPQRPTAPREFLAQGFREEAPSDLLLALAYTATLGTGAFTDLMMLGPIDKELIAQEAHNYPHLGFGDELDLFEAPPFDVEDIAFALRGTIDAFVRRSPFDDREAFVNSLADRLLAADKLDRACDVICAICPRKGRITWVEKHVGRLVSGSCFLPLLRLVESMRSMGMSLPHRSLLSTIEALCLHMLGDWEGACKSAKRYSFDQQVPAAHRIIGLVVLAKNSTGTIGQRASDELAILAASGDVTSSRAGAATDYIVLAQAWCALTAGTNELAAYWEAARGKDAPDELLAVIASWVYSAYGDELVAGRAISNVVPPFDSGSIERFVRTRIEASDPSRIDYFSASAGLAMESAHLKGMGYVDGPLPVHVLIALRNAELSMLAQRNRYEAEFTRSTAKRNDWLATHPDSTLDARHGSIRKQARLSVPTLNVKTFGHLEVSIGGKPVDQDRLKTKHVRSLIVLLAAAQGREISRDALSSAMWPHSPLEVSRKNFYSVWSALRQALMLPDGSCPYLIRHRSGCCFDTTHVQTDIARFEAICRAFLFEDPNYERWSELLAELDRDFSSDLLPSETLNELVIRAREEYRAKLVDALVAASTGIAETGNLRRAAWCAQTALDRDDTREDAYLALMRAQAALGQRAAAMATCRRGIQALAEKLGLDPSPEMMELYQQLLENETDEDDDEEDKRKGRR